MRFVITFTAVAGLWFGFSAFATPQLKQNTCGDELQAAMQDDPASEGTCEVVVTDGVRRVRKVFHAEVVNDMSDGQPDTKIQLKEFCDSCKTAGTTTLHAIVFKDIAEWAKAHATNEFDGEPDPETISNDCLISNDTMPTTPDMLQCRVSTLGAAAGADAAAYFGKYLQPRLQRLAVSRNAQLQSTLRQTLSALGPAARQNVVIGESVRQFQALIKVIDQANTYEQAMLAANAPAQAPTRVELTRQWKTVQNQAINDFNGRANALRTQGVTDPSVLGNGAVLANVVRTLGFPGGNAPNVPTYGNSPRTTFGTPGLPRVTPSSSPKTAPGQPGTVPAGLFHAS